MVVKKGGLKSPNSKLYSLFWFVAVEVVHHCFLHVSIDVVAVVVVLVIRLVVVLVMR